MNRWKEASSLIISSACKNQITQKTNLHKLKDSEKCDFEILALKKKENLPSGNPQTCVFPGGTFSVADSVKEWEGLFSNFGLTLNVLSSSLINENVTKLPIFNKNTEDIPRWLSLRITAIRETFEECGLLLCRSKNNTNNEKLSTIPRPSMHLAIDGIEPWREKVLADPFEFIALCKSYNCYPDVENLVLWSNWLTPSHMNDRFDAVFFFTELNNLTLFKVSPDNKEISSTEWLTPSELLEMSNKGEIFLKPPQWYEINSVVKIQTIGSWQKFMSYKSSNCHLWMPVRIIASDGEISLLPGDAMYPDEVDPFNPSPILRKEESMSSLRRDKMHRMEHKGVMTKLLDTRS